MTPPLWLRGYGAATLRQDFVAGMVVVMMLVPQSLAYALLAGLPAETGLFASILPLVAYAVFGSSRTMAVGPVAVVSLVTASALAPYAAISIDEARVAALQLALLSGSFLMLGGVLRLGVIANLLSNPVTNGFLSGSAVLIIIGQIMPLLGVKGAGQTGPELLQALLGGLGQFNPATTLLGLGAISALFLARLVLGPALIRLGTSSGLATLAVKLAPMCVVLAAMALTAGLGLDLTHHVAVVGPLPHAVPALAMPPLELARLQSLLMPAAAIALLSFISSISAAQSLALREREQVDPDRELLGLGAANVMAALAGGLPVAGGLSRSVVSHAAGARSPIAGVFTALALVVLLLTVGGAFSRLPICILAASIIVPMLELVDPSGLRRVWHYSPADGLAALATALGVLVMGVEAGIALGISLSLLGILWRASKPHIAVLGRVPGTQQYRNVLRAKVETWPEILLLRVDENLFFGNIGTVERALQNALTQQTTARHVVLVMSSVNSVDATAMERLVEINQTLKDQHIVFHLAEVKGPVLDRLERSPLVAALTGRIFRFTHEAFAVIAPDCV